MLSHKKGTAGKGIEEKQRECFLMKEGYTRDKAKDKLEVLIFEFHVKARRRERKQLNDVSSLFLVSLSPFHRIS